MKYYSTVSDKLIDEMSVKETCEEAQRVMDEFERDLAEISEFEDTTCPHERYEEDFWRNPVCTACGMQKPDAEEE